MRFPKILLKAGLIITLVLVAYSNTFNSDFHFDDLHQLVDNYNVKDLHNIPKFFTSGGMASYNSEAMGYRPLTYLSFAVVYSLSGYNVLGYHILNFFLHFLNSLLVLLIIRTIISRVHGNDPLSLPLAASLIFALHPIQTNTVTYISGLALLLASSFCLLSFYCFLLYRKNERRVFKYACLIFFLLGILTKEMAVCAPALFIAYDLIIGPKLKRLSIKKAAIDYLPFLTGIILWLVVRKVLLGFSAAPGTDIGRVSYLISEAKVFLLYLRLMFLPINQNVDYNLPITRNPDFTFFISATVIFIILFILFYLRKTRPEITFFGLWSFAALAPESTIFPILDIAVEYRLYLASAGFAAVLALSASLAIESPAMKKALTAFFIILLGVLTYNRNEVWKTELTLWGDTVGKSPYSARAHAAMGEALMCSGNYQDALVELWKAYENKQPYYRSAILVRLAYCLSATGRLQEAADLLRETIKNYPSNIEAYASLGDIYNRMGRYEEAERILMSGAALNGGFAEFHIKLYESYTLLGHNQDALREALLAVKYDPKNFVARYDLSVAYFNNGIYEKAVAEAESAARLAGYDLQAEDIKLLMKRIKEGPREPIMIAPSQAPPPPLK